MSTISDSISLGLGPSAPTVKRDRSPGGGGGRLEILKRFCGGCGICPGQRRGILYNTNTPSLLPSPPTCQDDPVLHQLVSLILCCSALLSNTESGSRLPLQDGDRIVLVGGTLIEREQKYGYWETALTLAYPELNLQFRNLGWSGDTVFGEARARFGPPAEGYKLLQDQLRAAKPTVLLIAYGGNEAFDGQPGLARFRTGLIHLLDDVAPLHARTVLLAPVPPARSPLEIKEQTLAYREVTQSVAQERRLAFADLLRTPDGVPAAPPAAWSDDGIHFNERGYRDSAKNFCQIFSSDDESKRPVITLTATLTPKGKKSTERFEVAASSALAVRPVQVVIKGLAPGRYRLRDMSQPDASDSLDEATSSEWAKGVVRRFICPDFRFEQLRAEIIAKNVHYFNRYRPQNETYLFGFRKHEQGQNAREVPLFDKLVLEAEKRIAELRKEAKVTVILNRVD
jgi:lysophospholipase L1-like esterase